MSISPGSGAYGLQRFAILIPAHYISKMVNHRCFLAPLLDEIKACAQCFLFRKFNFIQFLFEVFFNTIGTFGSAQSRSEPTFPYHYIIKFTFKMEGKRLPSPNSTPWGGRDTRALSFFLEI